MFAEFLNLFAFSLAGALCGAVFTPAFFIPGCAGLLLSVFAGVFAFVGAKILANVMVFLLGFPVENAYGPKKGLVLLMWSLFYTVTGAVFGLIFRYIYVMELLRMRIFSKKQN
ncbi:MAG: hypothetical protein KTR21_01425 [Rhodobacteraceae bacterium]|nr:hypothetical protein [Paracoccaceae bacterium]